AVRSLPVEVGLLGRKRVAVMECRSCPATASIFPLGLRRQAVVASGTLLHGPPGELTAEGDRILPGDLLHRVIGTTSPDRLEIRGILPHDGLVFTLRYGDDAQEERLGNRDPLPGHFIAGPFRLGPRRSDQERPRRE